ncbi:MAG TPA: hypothetical protein QGF58_29005 [Myxococcota bacterium]|nr:hypothetical protein [Myxococcota bacterium]
MLLLLLCCLPAPPNEPKADPMEWRGPEPAVVVEVDGEARAVQGTSTATLRLTGDVERLQMFGIGSSSLTRASGRDVPGPLAPRTCPPSSKETGARLEFFVSGARGEDAYDFRFLATDEPLTEGSCIPLIRRGVTWPLTILAKEGVETVERKMDVSYSGPSIVSLMHDKYLLLMVRKRSIDDRGLAELRPHDSLGDIVGWVSSDSSFREDVHGPVLVVDDLKARPDLDARAWLGVPGGVALDEDIYVYYATVFPEETFVDERPAAAARPGASVRHIQLEDLSALFDKEPKPESAWGRRTGLPGKELGLVRIWATVPGGAEEREVQPMEALYPDWRVADPQPASCREGVQLYFANVPDSARESEATQGGWGLWRASSFPDNVVLKTPSGPYRTVFGRDFVVRVDADRGTPDYVQPDAASSGRVFVDPDPVRVSDGRWLVYAGSLDATALWRFEGSHELGCRSWRSAWVAAKD